MCSVAHTELLEDARRVRLDSVTQALLCGLQHLLGEN